MTDDWGVARFREICVCKGLGERYSSTTLNGASIPSPDLTRNVIPLDIFPASIVSGLSVKDFFDIRANFAGGLIDVRIHVSDQGTNFSIEWALE